MEIWKDIKGYEGLYQCNREGEIKSLYTGKILKTVLRNGYCSVQLWKNGKRKNFKVHRIVAVTFIPNPDNLPQVNHKNEIKTDNRVENLEFCDAMYNINYGTGIERRAEKRKGIFNIKKSKPITQYTMDGLFIAEYPSAREAERQLGFNNKNICSCCKGKRKTAYGYKWSYTKE